MTAIQRARLMMDTAPISIQTPEEQMNDWVRRTGKMLADRKLEKWQTIFKFPKEREIEWNYYLRVSQQIEKQTV